MHGCRKSAFRFLPSFNLSLSVLFNVSEKRRTTATANGSTALYTQSSPIAMQQRAKLHPAHVPPRALPGSPPQPHLPVAQEVLPAPSDAVLFLAQFPRAVVPVARAEAELVEDEGDEGAVVRCGPFGFVVVVVLFGFRFLVRGCVVGGGGGGGVCCCFWGVWSGGGCEDGGIQGVKVFAVEAEREAEGTGALALGGGGSGVLGVFLVVTWKRKRVLAVFVAMDAEGAATLEIAARGWFCDLGVLDCVRLCLSRLRAGPGCEDDGAAEMGWCTDNFRTRREGGKVAGEERLQRATGAVHV